jgi:bisphosphoglycerate-dependent phosphoglycerate mutase
MCGSGSLVLLRHGERTANAARELTGLLDVELTSLGAQEARAAARLLAASDAMPDQLLTSLLRRSTFRPTNRSGTTSAVGRANAVPASAVRRGRCRSERKQS